MIGSAPGAWSSGVNRQWKTLENAGESFASEASQLANCKESGDRRKSRLGHFDREF